ncbi:MAG: alkaline phosphatase [Clostridia bacterium]|nr:alkaline phosphatase [Clostridia bacterium]
MKSTRKVLAFLLALVLVLPAMFACNESEPADTTPTDTTAPEETVLTLNGAPLSEYTIVYSESGLDFNKRAAEYVAAAIEAATGTAPAVKLDTEAEATDKEILVGITNRQADLGIEGGIEGATKDFEFLTASKDTKVLLYGEEYMIAGAAYAFAKTLAAGNAVTVPAEVTVGAPVFEDPRNVIFMIGDGMGFNTLKLGLELYENNTFPEKENISGYHQKIVADRLPYKAQHYTHSIDYDVTDSAAGGTALATGYKAFNSVIGLDINMNEIQNLTELAMSLGKKTGVLTTDEITGATPSAFSVHAKSRENTEEILEKQNNSNIDILIGDITDPGPVFRNALESLRNDDKGFFVMYEEAHIDKYSHANEKDNLYTAYTRLNTALRVAFEFMMYNPDTLLLLTADHETGGITYSEDKGCYIYTGGDHTQVNVPFYAIGKGAEEIDGKTYDNTGVAKYAARIMGVTEFGDPELTELTDKTGEEQMTMDEKNAIAIIRFKAFREYDKRQG